MLSILQPSVSFENRRSRHCCVLDNAKSTTIQQLYKQGLPFSPNSRVPYLE